MFEPFLWRSAFGQKLCDAYSKDQSMTRDIEKRVAQAYDARWLNVSSLDDLSQSKIAYSGWDAGRLDLRQCAKDYATKCRLRLMRHIPPSGDYMLDVGSGPLLFKEYVEYSRNFRKRYCIDLSSVALEEAKKKIGDHGVFLHGSLFDVPLEPDFFDCTLSILTIFNIHKDKQEDAVRKLIEVTKPGRPIIIVYRNPKSAAFSVRKGLRRRYRALGKTCKRFLKRREKPARGEEQSLYYDQHPIAWWDRFSDAADIQIMTWAYLSPYMQKALIPDNALGRKLLEMIFWAEERFPHRLGKRCAYPIIILTKKPSALASRETSGNPRSLPRRHKVHLRRDSDAPRSRGSDSVRESDG
jgi:ubiquinone/menaquinone biosynthesis C-methylase UbiE